MHNLYRVQQSVFYHRSVPLAQLIVPKGIFLDRLDKTLQFRNGDRDNHSVNENAII